MNDLNFLIDFDSLQNSGIFRLRRLTFWYLELSDEVLHEPLTVCFGVEIFVPGHLHIDSHSFGLDLGNVLERGGVRASFIGCSYEHRNRNLLNVANRYHVRCVFASFPVSVRDGLLEAI